MPRSATARVGCLTLFGAGLVVSAQAEEVPQMDRLRVNGTELTYVEQGTGVPVIFVHGGWMDLRYWEPQRDAVAERYRFVAYKARYHGTAPWPDKGEHYSLAQHAADLAGFIRALNAGPAHLVTLSSGGVFGALVAMEHRELVRSLTLAEPAMAALLVDIPEAEPALAQRGEAFRPIIAAAKAGDAVTAAKLFFDAVNNQGEGAFDQQPDAFRQMVLDNARTVPLLLAAFAAAPPSAISCARLGAVTAPTLVVGGAETMPYFTMTNEAVTRCIPDSRLVVVPDATHLMSRQNPTPFNQALMDFLARH